MFWLHKGDQAGPNKLLLFKNYRLSFLFGIFQFNAQCCCCFTSSSSRQKYSPNDDSVPALPHTPFLQCTTFAMSLFVWSGKIQTIFLLMILKILTIRLLWRGCSVKNFVYFSKSIRRIAKIAKLHFCYLSLIFIKEVTKTSGTPYLPPSLPNKSVFWTKIGIVMFLDIGFIFDSYRGKKITSMQIWIYLFSFY